MSNVKLLFAPETSGVARRIAEALSESGHEAVDGAARGATASIVVWSPGAGASSEILHEARLALSRRVLVPVTVSKAPPPPSFEHLWPMDLTGWGGEAEDPRWRFVLDEIELAARRGVELETSAQKAYQPADLVAGPKLKPAPKPKEAPKSPAELEDLFADPVTYRVETNPRPRIPLAALLAGFAFLGIVSGGAFLAGRQATHTERTARTGPEAAPPVIAVLEPKHETPDVDVASSPASSPISEEGNVFADADAASINVGAADLRDGLEVLAVEPSTDDVRPNTRAGNSFEARASEADEFANGESINGAGVQNSAAEPAAEPIMVAAGETAPKLSEADDADPIAGLAFDAVANADQIVDEAETVALGRYFRDCLDCPDMAEIRNQSARDFAIGVREVTVDQWLDCVEAKVCARIQGAPSPGGGAFPVINVSYEDALTYVSWLTRKTGVNYRLPSEAEWDAASGSTNSESGLSAPPVKANLAGGSVVRGRAAPTASYSPNEFGLYDVFGNVWEWTMGCWGDAAGPCESRVLKGGAFDTAVQTLASADRAPAPANARRVNVGFRVARDLP